MAIFKDKNLMEKLFGELWSKMINETEFGPKIKKDGIAILFIVTDPDVLMFMDGDGPVFGADAEKKVPMVTMKMSGDTVHKFWLKHLKVPKAMALGQIKAKGHVGKILKLLPMLEPGQALYPGYCEKYNLPTAYNERRTSMDYFNINENLSKRDKTIDTAPNTRRHLST